MIRSTEAQIDAPSCPTCVVPMRLSRVTPSITEYLENRVFTCTRCGTEITRMVRSGPSSAYGLKHVPRELDAARLGG
jgi:hypothetical protein